MVHALTIRSSNGIVNCIISDVGVSRPYIEKTETSIQPFRGIWDTGASGSVITKNVADKLDIKPTGQRMVNHAQGSDITNTYFVNLVLPSNVTVENVTVMEGKLPEGVDLLIGMDIVTLGDFSITNKDGMTVMSFRIPSMVCHDYVAEANRQNQINIIRQNETMRSKQKNIKRKKKNR